MITWIYFPTNSLITLPFSSFIKKNQNLENAASTVENWSVGNQMKINNTKTKELTICFKKIQPVLDPLEISDTYLNSTLLKAPWRNNFA